VLRVYPWIVSAQGSGPRVVLVHGSASNGGSWSSQAPLAASFELVVPSRGGCWPNPPRLGAPFEVQAAELAELIEPGTHLVGHSYGGVLSMLAAALRVDDVASLTVLEPPLLGIARGVPAVDAEIAAHKELDAIGSDDPREYLLQFFALVGSPHDPPDPLPQRLRQAVETMRSEPHAFDLELPPELDPPPFRCLVVSGAHSASHEAVCDALAPRLRAERAVLTGAGHNIPRVGEPFNELLRHFVLDG
jgi:pimeloyl-ACP methyl ester carboxylesterase